MLSESYTLESTRAPAMSGTESKPCCRIGGDRFVDERDCRNSGGVNDNIQREVALLNCAAWSRQHQSSTSYGETSEDGHGVTGDMWNGGAI